jgi:hypothetical protein
VDAGRVVHKIWSPRTRRLPQRGKLFTFRKEGAVESSRSIFSCLGHRSPLCLGDSGICSEADSVVTELSGFSLLVWSPLSFHFSNFCWELPPGIATISSSLPGLRALRRQERAATLTAIVQNLPLNNLKMACGDCSPKPHSVHWSFCKTTWANLPGGKFVYCVYILVIGLIWVGRVTEPRGERGEASPALSAG